MEEKVTGRWNTMRKRARMRRYGEGKDQDGEKNMTSWRKG